MKAFASWLLGAILLGACNEATRPVAPTTEQPTGLRASQFTDNAVIPLDIFVFVPCAAGSLGEYVRLTGNLHALFHVTVSNSGKFTIKGHFQPQGVRGTGQSTGAKYQGTGVTQDLTHFGRVGQVFTFVNNFRIIGQGRGNNFLVHDVFHITINANGTLTAFVDGFKADCK
jgi:hypothetical protein